MTWPHVRTAAGAIFMALVLSPVATVRVPTSRARPAGSPPSDHVVTATGSTSRAVLHAAAVGIAHAAANGNEDLVGFITNDIERVPARIGLIGLDNVVVAHASTEVPTEPVHVVHVVIALSCPSRSADGGSRAASIGDLWPVG